MPGRRFPAEHPPVPTPTAKTMKRIPLLMLGTAALLLLSAVWTPGALAAARSSEPALPVRQAQVGYPLHHSCVVTVDPYALSKTEIVGLANKSTGFVAPDTAEGVLVRLDDEWLVLRDGIHDNWIPKAKVLMIHVLR
jgi:hypothetical protein